MPDISKVSTGRVLVRIIADGHAELTAEPGDFVQVLLHFLGFLEITPTISIPLSNSSRGVPLLLLSSRESSLLLLSGLVKAPGSEHRVEHVASAACESNEGLVVSLALGDFPVVVCT